MQSAMRVAAFRRLQLRWASAFVEKYNSSVAERGEIGLPAKSLDAAQVAELVELAKNPPADEKDLIKELLSQMVPAGVDEAAYVKAAFLADVALGKTKCDLYSREDAVKLLGTMQGGYNVVTLVELLSDADAKIAELACDELKHTILVFDAFHDVEELSKTNKHAKAVMQSWADAEWFLSRPEVPAKQSYTVFKVTGETNTDDLSPAPDAWSRPDVPFHARAMLKIAREGIEPDVPGEVGPIKQINELKKKGNPLVYVGDVVGTGSSRKSGTNSVLWYIGHDIDHVPNKKTGGLCLGGKIAPIFFNTMEDSGALPIECDVSNLDMGDEIDVCAKEGVIYKKGTDQVLSQFTLKTDILLDEVRAGGRIALIIGRGVTSKARKSLGLPASTVFKLPKPAVIPDVKGYTLAQKMVGRACDVEGVLPGTYCEPKVTSVGSQDTTGPMTRDELKDLACLGFSADLVMQSFCHTAAYPKPVDVAMHHSLPEFIHSRGGVALRPGDGIIHSWLNRMLLPDTVGTGGDSHTRFPIGISFPAGSGLVAFGAATGVIPLDMPESILVRFHGKMQPGITLRDLVHSIPLKAIELGHLTVPKKNKKNIFSGEILEIEGLEDLKCEQAFELSDASAERSAAGCSIKLNKEPIIEYLKSNIVMLRWMVEQGYQDKRTLLRRAEAMEAWIAKPELLEADKDAKYKEIIDIDLNELKEPVLCAPNDPDDARTLSDCAGQKVDEVFIGSCMTNIGHFRAAGKLLKTFKGKLTTKLWIAPPTKMDEKLLKEEGYYEIFEAVGARTEMPGCSLCMGNQARVEDRATVVSTSTRNFPNRLGNGANVFLSSAELAAVAAILGRIPTKEEYMQYASQLDSGASDTYRYMNFNEINSFSDAAQKAVSA
ncbi:Aconitate hydratase B [Diplonema papillatum]|nr:Aconitate hydratase B [Diplonema papillatum]